MYRQNLQLISKNNLQLLHLVQLRSITQAIEKISDEASAQNLQWEQAKPFDKVPGPSRLQLLRNFLPGGLLNKVPVEQYLNKTREVYGDLHIIPGVLGRPDLLVCFNPDDFPTVLRSEGVWPQRRGIETMRYHRQVHRKDLFGDAIGLVSSNGEDWGKFRSMVNPILMQPRNAKLYLNNMLEVSDEFLKRVREIRDPETLEVPETFEDEINHLTFESVAVIALNRQLGLIRKNRNDEEAKMIFESLRSFFALALVMDMGVPVWKYFKTKQFHQMMKNYDTLAEISNKYINEAIEKIENDKTERKENEEKSVLEKLLKIDRKVARTMALDLMMGGVDTTSSRYYSWYIALYCQES